MDEYFNLFPKQYNNNIFLKSILLYIYLFCVASRWYPFSYYLEDHLIWTLKKR